MRACVGTCSPASHAPTPRGYACHHKLGQIGHGMSTRCVHAAPICAPLAPPPLPPFESKPTQAGIPPISDTPSLRPLSSRDLTAHRACSQRCAPAAPLPLIPRQAARNVRITPIRRNGQGRHWQSTAPIPAHPHTETRANGHPETAPLTAPRTPSHLHLSPHLTSPRPSSAPLPFR